MFSPIKSRFLYSPSISPLNLQNLMTPKKELSDSSLSTHSSASNITVTETFQSMQTSNPSQDSPRSASVISKKKTCKIPTSKSERKMMQHEDFLSKFNESKIKSELQNKTLLAQNKILEDKLNNCQQALIDGNKHLDNSLERCDDLYYTIVRDRIFFTAAVVTVIYFSFSWKK